MTGLTKEFTEAELLKREKEIEQRIEKAKQTREEFDEARYELFYVFYEKILARNEP